MSYSKMVKLLLITAIFPLLLTACFSDSEKLKSDLSASLKKQTTRTGYNFEGSAALDLLADFEPGSDDMFPQDTSWEWSGYVHENANELFIEASGRIGNESVEFKLIQDEGKRYTHFPQVNENGEFFVQNVADEQTTGNGYISILSEFAEAAKATEAKYYRQSTEENGDTTITVAIEEDNQASWLEAVSRAIHEWPFSQTSDEDVWDEQLKNNALKKPGSLKLTWNEKTGISDVQFRLETENFTFETNQTFTNAETSDPAAAVERELPWDDVMAQLDVLLAEKQTGAEGIEFEQGIELQKQYDYSGDPARQAIADVIEANMQALIDHDKASFDATFRKEVFAERHTELWNSERKYRFLQIEDLQFKTLSGGDVRVGVLYEYVDPGDQSVSISGFTYYVSPNEQGEWKIDSIK